MKDLKMKGLESKDGVVKLFGERIVFIPPSIISLLGQIYGEGASPLLKYLGKKMGRRLIEMWEEHLRPKTLEQLTEIFLDMQSTSGWGSFSAEKISEEEIIVKLEHNIGKAMTGNSTHIDYFISGLLSGFGEFALYSAQVTIKDTEEENSTEFVVKKRNIDF
ncbi:MAG: hypothetical protein GF364_07765 [Candidatus Lokiarchaeota archaeon]|nr:hypothetical protein [Candidatus Lokiarchaeota archaeon]